MKYKHLFFDLDHTLWDFEANSKTTLKELYTTLQLGERGINDIDLFHKNYLQHNEKLWERYRNGYIKQEELRIKRMWLSLLDFNIDNDSMTGFSGPEETLLIQSRHCAFHGPQSHLVFGGPLFFGQRRCHLGSFAEE